jgi:hypothetical protein
MRTATMSLLVVMIACSPQPEQVFAPAKAFHHTVRATTTQGAEPSVRVGEPLTLQATRTSGPWVQIPRRSVPADGCWVAPPPPAEEPEVADNLHWVVEPDGQAVFDLGLRDDHTRVVRFSRPGRYVLHAVGSMWCSPPTGSNAITVVVRE